VLPVDEYNRPRVPARIDTPYLPAFFVRAQVMGEPALRVIATELVKSIKSNVSVDWMHREAARARDPGSGEAPAAQIRLPARLAGCGRAEGPATGRGIVGSLGGVMALVTQGKAHHTPHRARAGKIVQ
jgi:hypothetical protein